jgi:hypothetical protein
MKLLLDLIDWEYPSKRRDFQPELWNLGDQDKVWKLVLAFGNGIILELRAEGDTEEALHALRGLALKTGACKPLLLSEDERAKVWLYRAGDEAYRQPNNSAGYVFIDPVPRPEKFGA